MFLALVLTALFLGLLYTWTVRGIYSDWVKVPVWIIPKAYRPQAKISILVPARNEENHIASCIESLLNQVWPSDKIEILVLDDRSTDRTAELVESIKDPRLKLLKLSEIDPEYSGTAFKKRAIQIAMGRTSADYILTTDADCSHHKHWAASMVSLAEQNNKEYVTGPVRIHPTSTSLEKYQALDTLGMNAVNAAGLHAQTRAVSCGANSLFTPTIFNTVNGFAGVDAIATGDDVFLVEKIMQHNPDLIAYNKSREAIVDTQGKKSLQEIITQRHRWAAKFKHIHNTSTKRLMVIVGLYYALFWLSILAAIFLSPQYLFIAGILFFFKLRSDFWYLRQLTGEFEQSILSGFPVATVLSYVIDPIVALKALLQPKYKWKGRVVR